MSSQVYQSYSIQVEAAVHRQVDTHLPATDT